jgi:hypothetical protein
MPWGPQETIADVAVMRLPSMNRGKPAPVNVIVPDLDATGCEVVTHAALDPELGATGLSDGVGGFSPGEGVAAAAAAAAAAMLGSLDGELRVWLRAATARMVSERHIAHNTTARRRRFGDTVILNVDS